ncbi:MAG TPA: alpha-isopropylmalate synthase regulatory domain-containing protein, partial [Tepidisphaeraceae bacterium]|nr:alpha-isopropylmalate synthase regulatory domain-containing protein [Tepidisphaeraceae bacterium]
VPPQAVGNTRRILISELSGVSNIATKAGAKFNLQNDRETLRRVLIQVQDLENAGYQFEAAEASFELLVRKQIGRHRRFFDLEHYRVIVLKMNSATPVAEATVKIRLDGGQVEHRVAEGDGPVAALDAALRRALKARYPQIDGVHLIDYKVRVINSKDETSAAVRVVIECRRDTGNGTKEIFGTIGVSQNIIDASWQALVDAYEYHLIHVEEAQQQLQSSGTE